MQEQQQQTHIDCGDFYLRPLVADDKHSLVQHANNRSIWKNMRDRFPHPYTLQHAENFIAMSASQQKVITFGIIYNNECIGISGVFPQEDVYCLSAELGYWIGEKYWNKGVATTALIQVIKYVFETTSLERLYAGVFEWNPASMRVLEKCGFRLECIAEKAVLKDGQLISEHRYVMLKP